MLRLSPQPVTSKPGRRRVGKPSSCACRRGISLLEVILAIAILGGALATIGEIIRLGVRSANYAQQQTMAQMICDAKMAELAAGALPLQPSGQTPCDEDGWVYSVEVSSSEVPGLLQVMVMVQQDPAQYPIPETFRLYRYMPDPEYVQELEEAAEAVY